MTSYKDIDVSHDGHVAIVEIQRPPHNFFDHSLISQIADAFTVADDDPNCRSIVLAAQGYPGEFKKGFFLDLSGIDENNYLKIFETLF